MKYLFLLLLLLGCEQNNEGSVAKKTPLDVIKEDIAALEYEYSSLTYIGATSLIGCGNTANYGELINTICLYKNESNNALKSHLVSATISFSSFIYADLIELRQEIDALSLIPESSLNYHNKKLYVSNKLNDFYTKFNFISKNSNTINTTIDSLQNSILNANNTQNIISVLQSQITAIQTQISSIDLSIDNLETQSSSIDLSIDNLETQIDTLRNEDVSINNQLDTLTNKDIALNNEIISLENDLTNLNADLVSVNNQINTLENNLTDLNTDLVSINNTLDSANTDIGAIQVSLNNMIDIYLIGENNLTAGPVYEAVFKRRDKKQVIGYRRGNNTVIRLPNNPLASVNLSPIVTVTTSANHGLNVGDVVQLAGLTAAANFTTGQVSGAYSVQTIVSTVKFTITLTSNANLTSAGFGGANGSFQKVFNEGLSMLWKSGQVSDTSVRQTSIGTTTYNYLIRRISSDVTNNTAELCYDKTSNSATFLTINAAPVGGTGNITCF